jgi:hypothetical protein
LGRVERQLRIGRDENRGPIDPLVLAAIERLEVQVAPQVDVSHSFKGSATSKV